MQTWSTLFRATALAVAGLVAQSAGAAYPERAIQIVVPFAAGSPPDLLARVLAEGWKRSGFAEATIVNQPGVGGSLGVAQVAKAAPDGYTVAIAGDAAVLVNPALYPERALSPLNDLAPVSQLIVTPTVLVVGKDLPVSNLAELLALARAKPGELSFASAGAGTSSRRNGELLKQAAGVNLLHVPYKTSPTVDVVAGRVTMFFAPPSVAPMVADGRLRALAVSSPGRLARFPDVPTTSEAGFPQVNSLAWFGLVAPAGTPMDRVERLRDEAAKVMQDPAAAKQLETLGGSPVLSSPKEFRDLIARELPRWREFVREVGIQPD
ncbi:tripartite tricarboxylate transporter substrate-binding protein [Piscinibacter sakaiensis]|jgi:tripartite-type tricarboxylate transporter receptor subunit TctC|uniref:Putative exported protein n=1 Tax=Piscinibacter sakaiensis TaxID=1547922 RepID=A0A0K8P6Y1_PISS1|nr:tripartite tricarboxylate transporter substrate-binding protein [Piscinibacter sakaiensis]GAP38377.1 putative exported protein [Piscinibacter sakaiensis]